jgi:hypothetical protein
MRTRMALSPLLVVVALASGSVAQAQLPDLRGKTLFVTGTLHVEGDVTILGTPFSFSEDFTLDADSPAKIVFDNTGPEDNSALTGTLPLPPVVTGDFPVCGNPSVPITASFDRTTGAFTIAGLLPGDSQFDFGVYDLGAPVGEQRILVIMQDLALTTTGTGAIDPDSTFRIQQPGDSPFTYAIFGGVNGRPRLALVNPQSCTFGGILQSNVSNSSLILRNWTAALPSISGTVTLEDCPNADVPMIFTFHPSDNSGDFDVTVTPSANGTFTVPNLPAKSFTIRVKGERWLSKTVQANTTNGNVTGVNVGALKGGDANNSNSVDVLDLAVLIQSFDFCEGDAEFLSGADFDCSGCVDVLDLDILIRNFDAEGDPFP